MYANSAPVRSNYIYKVAYPGYSKNYILDI